ncbi:hypothetical protein KKD52_04260 [Myxococcota bacterium]|nr:hypothetical protein [Myxococcota bacterium]MBU1410696.1 hypothetical protein [Myxococcota bacterium]MBU1509556.1 hypothetical protein [Myxococcota bacterium]
MLTALQIFLAFVIAGSWISTATWIAEKKGSRVGGLLVNLPSNLLVSLIFMAVLRGPQYAAGAAAAVPIGMGINSIFLALFIWLVPRGLVLATGISLLYWFGAAWLTSRFPLTPWQSLAAYTLILVATMVFAEKILKVRTPPRREKTWSTWQFLLRALFSGGLVASVVAISLTTSSWITGIVSTFPAVMMSSMVILTLTQGPDFARATGKILIFSSVNILVYSHIVQFAYPTLGVVVGTLLAYAGAVLFVIAIRPVSERLS